MNNPIIDLTDDNSDVSENSLNDQNGVIDQNMINHSVWVAFHQLEAGPQCVGDFSTDSDRDMGNLSHNPTNFDREIIGIYDSYWKACQAALESGIENGIDGSEDLNGANQGIIEEAFRVQGYRGQGLFMDSEDSCTFAERVFVEEHIIE